MLIAHEFLPCLTVLDRFCKNHMSFLVSNTPVYNEHVFQLQLCINRPLQSICELTNSPPSTHSNFVIPLTYMQPKNYCI